jgi:hypothetical protein
MTESLVHFRGISSTIEAEYARRMDMPFAAGTTDQFMTPNGPAEAADEHGPCHGARVGVKPAQRGRPDYVLRHRADGG